MDCIKLKVDVVLMLNTVKNYFSSCFKHYSSSLLELFLFSMYSIRDSQLLNNWTLLSGNMDYTLVDYLYM